MGKTSSKYTKRSKYSTLSTRSESYYTPSEIGYDTQSIPALSETSADVIQSYSYSLYGYSAEKFPSKCIDNFRDRALDVHVSKASDIPALTNFKIDFQSEKVSVPPTPMILPKEDRATGKMLT